MIRIDDRGGAAAERAAKAARVRAMFGRIVPRYDRINSLMTFGMDRRWREAAVAMVRPRGGLVLDVATGTGELAFELIRQGARKVVGVDFCAEMMEAAVGKTARNRTGRKIAFVAGDALRLPFSDDSFDATVNGFLLRNLVELRRALAEFYRVLKPGGRIACLDVTHPPKAIRPLCLAYFNGIVPIIGGVLSGDYAAYRYLPNSLKELPDAKRLARMMSDIGFIEVGYRLFNFGLIAIHTARK